MKWNKNRFFDGMKFFALSTMDNERYTNWDQIKKKVALVHRWVGITLNVVDLNGSVSQLFRWISDLNLTLED